MQLGLWVAVARLRVLGVVIELEEHRTGCCLSGWKGVVSAGESEVGWALREEKFGRKAVGSRGGKDDGKGCRYQRREGHGEASETADGRLGLDLVREGSEVVESGRDGTVSESVCG